jgi:solute carrier family 35 protein E1
MGGKSGVRKPPTMLVSASLLAIWFSSSVCSTLVNKDLMDRFPYAVTLSAVHMLSSALVDLAIVWYRGLNIQFRKDVLWGCLPVALTINFGKTLTYVSYGLVPASLTHTAKASSPVFSVLVSKVLFNQVPTLATFLSLIPITVGVTLSALTEINWVFLGFLAAVCAALANVLNSTYTKKGLHHVNAPDPLIFHMYTAFAAVVMLLPYAMVVEMPTISLFTPSTLLPPPDTDGPATLAPLPIMHVFPWRSMLLSLLLHYAQNISNIYFLSGVSVLTHQVAQSLKRLLNIAGAVLYFGNTVTMMNGVGMGLALLGFSMYSAAKQRAPRVRTTSAAARTVSPVHGGVTNGTDAASQMQRALLAAHGPNGLAHHGSGHGTPVSIIVEPANGVYAHTNGSKPSIELQSWSAHANVHANRSDDEATPSVSPDYVIAHALHPTAHAQALLHAQALATAAGHSMSVTTMQNGQQLQSGNESPQASDREDENFCV